MATTLADFGDPLSATDYRLCVYGSTGLEVDVPVAPAGVCDGRSCWTAGRRGFRYRDLDNSSSAASDLLLRTGDNRRAATFFAAGGPLLKIPPLPLPLPATVQLRAATGVCWTTTHSAATLNTARKLRSRPE